MMLSNTVASLANIPGDDGKKRSELLLTYSFCLLSGVTFMLIGCCWLYSYRWNNRPANERIFTGLGCFSCFMVILLVSCNMTVSVLLYMKYLLDYSLPQLYQEITPILVLGSLGLLIGTFFCCAYFYSCWKYGRSPSRW